MVKLEMGNYDIPPAAAAVDLHTFPIVYLTEQVLK
jgi:hypothetical protein